MCVRMEWPTHTIQHTTHTWLWFRKRRIGIHFRLGYIPGMNLGIWGWEESVICDDGSVNANTDTIFNLVNDHLTIF